MLTSEFYVRSDSVVSRVIGGETLVVPIRGSVGDLTAIYSLNDVATMIWRTLENPTSLDGLVRVIESQYEVSRQRAEQDVQFFLAEMSAAGLLHPSSVSDSMEHSLMRMKTA